VRRVALGFALLMLATMAAAMDIDALWEYGDPAASEARFRAALATSSGEDERLELLTQIARTHSLRGDFASAHRMLDELEPRLATVGAAPKVRALLERGRCFASAGEPARARPLFEAALRQAQVARLDGLAVDAAHMIAITHGASAQAIEWNGRGLALARASKDAKARALIPALLNNLAWDLHDMRRYAEALPLFEQALAEWRAREAPEQIRVAQWSVARCLRSLGRYEEALAMQRRLEALPTIDGNVFEEIAENLTALHREAEARPYFARAAEEFGKDPQFVKAESARLESLRSRSR
jgi:tetratricopeptide (TPR) repeat protein